MLPTILEGHKPHDVGNRAYDVSRPAGSPISNHMISQSGANFPYGMLRVAYPFNSALYISGQNYIWRQRTPAKTRMIAAYCLVVPRICKIYGVTKFSVGQG